MPVICYSAGLDSTVLLWDILKNKFRFGVDPSEPVIPFFVNFGTASDKEAMKLIKAQRKHAKTKHAPVIHECTIKRLPTRADSGPPYEMPSSASEEIRDLFIPGRHAYIYLAAMMHAASLKMTQVFVAAQGKGAPAFDQDEDTDGSLSFIDNLSDALAPAFVSCENPPKLCTPYRLLSKADIVRIGKQVNAPLHLTNSCEYGLRCGRCAQCVAASKALREGEYE